MALTPRDLTIFRLLSLYRFLRSTYLYAFVGGASETRFKERLGDLFHEGYLDRPDQQWRYAEARCQPTVHSVGEGAKRALLDSGRSADDARTFLGVSAQRQFQHAMLICDVLASIELATQTLRSVRFIPWGEISSRAAQTRHAASFVLAIPNSTSSIVPDGLFGLEYSSSSGRKSYRFFALEIDRATMPVSRQSSSQTSYAAKLGAYRQILAGQVFKSQLGVPNLNVLTLTTNEVHLRTILASLGPPARENAAFLFKALPGALSRPNVALLCEAWSRLDAAALDISTA